MLTIKTKLGQVLKIAPTARAFDDSLFSAGGTFDGWIVRRSRFTVTFRTIGDREYFVNRWGVLGSVGRTPDGRRWYQYQLDFDWASQHEFVDSLTIARDWSGRELSRRFA